MKATLAMAEGVRLTYFSGFAWLSAECSLPGLLRPDNSVLLTWPEVLESTSAMWALASGQVEQDLPPVPELRVSRFDPVYAWDTEPGPYLRAIRFACLPRTEPVVYKGGVLWKTRHGRTRARAYDKALEAGHPVDEPLRLERQVRPRRERVRVGGQLVGRRFADLDPGVCLGILRQAMAGLGLDRPTPTIEAARARVFAAYSPRQARNLWGALCDRANLGEWPPELPRTTRYDYVQMALACGVAGLSLEGELPALAVGTTCLSNT